MAACDDALKMKYPSISMTTSSDEEDEDESMSLNSSHSSSDSRQSQSLSSLGTGSKTCSRRSSSMAHDREHRRHRHRNRHGSECHPRDDNGLGTSQYSQHSSQHANTSTSEKKDEKYWERRKKNNEAAKRSREKRRMNDVAMEIQVSELSRENALLKEEVALLKKCAAESLVAAASVGQPHGVQSLHSTQTMGIQGPVPWGLEALPLSPAVGHEDALSRQGGDGSETENKATPPSIPQSERCPPPQQLLHNLAHMSSKLSPIGSALWDLAKWLPSNPSVPMALRHQRPSAFLSPSGCPPSSPWGTASMFLPQSPFLFSAPSASYAGSLSAPYFPPTHNPLLSAGPAPSLPLLSSLSAAMGGASAARPFLPSSGHLMEASTPVSAQPPPAKKRSPPFLAETSANLCVKEEPLDLTLSGAEQHQQQPQNPALDVPVPSLALMTSLSRFVNGFDLSSQSSNELLLPPPPPPRVVSESTSSVLKGAPRSNAFTAMALSSSPMEQQQQVLHAALAKLCPPAAASLALDGHQQQQQQSKAVPQSAAAKMLCLTDSLLEDLRYRERRRRNNEAVRRCRENKKQRLQQQLLQQKQMMEQSQQSQDGGGATSISSMTTVAPEQKVLQDKGGIISSTSINSGDESNHSLTSGSTSFAMLATTSCPGVIQRSLCCPKEEKLNG